MKVKLPSPEMEALSEKLFAHWAGAAELDFQHAGKLKDTFFDCFRAGVICGLTMDSDKGFNDLHELITKGTN